MKTAIIIHGMPSKKEYFDGQSPSQSNKHWLPWLQRQLIINGILAQTPEMPEPYEPVYEKWRKMFERFDINEDTTLVGHSCGGGFLLRWLSGNKVKVGKVALVAPFLDTAHTVSTGFFDFEIDGYLAERTKGLKIFYSTDDEEILDGVAILKEKLKNAQIKEFTGRGHFLFEQIHTHEFPELRDFLIQ